MTDAALAQLSDRLFMGAILLYTLAMLAYAGEQASRRSRSVAAAAAAGMTVRQAAAARTRAMAGGGTSTLAPEVPPAAEPVRGSRAGDVGTLLTAVGVLVHTGSVFARGFAVNRAPWGNMYEFSSAVALAAVGIFLALVLAKRVDRGLGAFVMLPAILYMGLAGTVLYAEAGPLAPALDSYWIKIHVFAAILSSGAFLLSGVVALLYLLRVRHDGQVTAGTTPRFPLSMGSSLPAAPVLDRVSYAVIAFAFPIWTFAIIAGAIWAESAWGRYWGWDPKETWSFITWVLYAGYLHARATAGWKGTKAAWIGVAAAIALIIDYYVVNIFVVGIHSYGGIG